MFIIKLILTFFFEIILFLHRSHLINYQLFEIS